MTNHKPTETPLPNVNDVLASFTDIRAVTVATLRRRFNITRHTALQVRRLAIAETARRNEKASGDVEELMRRFRFSESEAQWALANMGMPE